MRVVREFPSGLRIERLVTGPLRTNTYVLRVEGSDSAVIVDPGPGSCEALVKELRGLKSAVILITHGHFDHASDANCLRRGLKCVVKCLMHEADVRIIPESRSVASWYGVRWEDPVIDEYLRIWESSEEIELTSGLGIELVAIHTPGHTLGSVTYYLPREATALTGDTLFKGAVGRTDFPGGDPALMVESLRRLINKLPPNTLILPGHGPESTIQEELRSSKALRNALAGKI